MRPSGGSAWQEQPQHSGKTREQEDFQAFAVTWRRFLIVLKRASLLRGTGAYSTGAKNYP